ncbi:MAG: RnfABCDGE type electron transport complex subunit B [Bacillota bacterium]|nr:RnfABCDGE type electron transport complex subunit B [Bacillota bacterium]
MVEAILSLGVMGLLFGGLLAYAAQVFAVPTDPRVDQLTEALPSAQCGACGYPGCRGLAEAIVKGRAGISSCVVGGPTVAAEIARIMGVQAEEMAERQVAVVHCGGGAGKVSGRHLYDGIADCRAAVIPQVAGKLGHTLCSAGCLGFGTCVAVCPFDAIHMGPDGLPVVDREKCTACAKCVAACPRGIIELHPVSQTVHVLCRNRDRGAAVRRYCKVGCIACRACVRAVPEGYVIQDNLAAVDYSQKVDFGLAIPKCPTKTIVDLSAPAAQDQGAAAEGAKETA